MLLSALLAAGKVPAARVWDCVIWKQLDERTAGQVTFNVGLLTQCHSKPLCSASQGQIIALELQAILAVNLL